MAAFRAECARRGIRYRESHPAPDLLFSALSAPLIPGDLHLPGQRIDQV